ncbi:MAG: methionine synthase [Phycisphaeraceae bacterium]
MSSEFLKQLDKRVLFFDGAMGTSIHEVADLDLDRDYLGKENCTEVLVKTRPEVIQQIHESFLEVGADGVETDTFGANKLVFAEFDLVEETYELNKLAAEVARKACDNHATPDKPRFVVGSMGPGTKLLTLGHTTWDLMLDSYTEQCRGLIDGGIDVFLIETCQDILQVKCAVNACIDALKEKGKTVDDIPIMVQVTIETTGTMLVGTEIAAAAMALQEFPIASLGMNCATGPDEMAEHVQWLSEYWPHRISLLPNAGLPTLQDGKTVYPLDPKPFAKKVADFVDRFGINIVGGCCGTTPEHIGELVKAVGERAPKPRELKPIEPGCTSLYSTVDYRQDNSLLNVGERTNASGSRRFKRLLEAEDWDEMVSLAREQTKEGSHVIDVNVDYAGRDNAADMAEIVHRFVRQVNAPLMLDSTQTATIEAGLKNAGGKCIINSANLEEGEEKFAQMCHLAMRYGAGLVMGTIDEDEEEAMARTADRKVEIARRMYKLATEKYGMKPEDIMFDPLVLPISTGMEKDRRSALELIEGTKRIAKEFPKVQITCGLSNVSFGLNPAARQVLNSVMLHELTEAGMTSAIVHVSKILPRNKIEDKQWDAALNVIYDRKPAEKVKLEDGTLTEDPLQIFIDLFHGAEAVTTKEDIADLPLEERLQRHIIDGEKKGITETLEEAMKKYEPLAIINDHLLGGMKVVGELFGSGQMQLPFVLQSAEVMKMAVAHLEPHMEKKEGDTKGTITLATVKGDVHDIGKNLVDIILSNNGYTVHNIGIKQPISAIIENYTAKKSDAIGLSGLLVKSVQVMEENLKEMNAQGITAPVILGGAALSRHHCEHNLRAQYEGHVFYGLDAFEGLRIMDRIMAGETDELNTEIDERLTKRAAVEETIAKRDAARKEASAGEGGTAVAEKTRSDVAADIDVPTPPFYGTKIVEDIELDKVFEHINTIALFRGQWQFKKGKLSKEDYEKLLTNEVEPIFDRLKKQCKAEGILQPKVVYGYFPVQSEGNDLIVFDADDHEKEVERFSFPRQNGKKHYCISDFFRSTDSGEKDVLAMSCVTMGKKVSEITAKLFEDNNYAEYLYMHGMGVESAEGLAEYWHRVMRQELGIDDQDADEVRKLFTQHYRGSRYSFGYPACPEMSDQDKLWRLLEPGRIGCVLTENWQIDPEQSTSAIIVHHPEAKYFNV